VSQGVEREGPDIGVVGLREGGARLGGGGGGKAGAVSVGDVPVEDGAFGAARDEDGMDGVPGQRWGGAKQSKSVKLELWER
jgi:hypothetical protein